MIVERLNIQQWAKLSEDAHKIAFQEIKPAAIDRIDFALLAAREVDKMPLAYITCRETTSESVYIQYGGVFPGTRGTRRALEIFSRFLDVLRTYPRVTMLVENTNAPMLRIAVQSGFLIMGIRNYKNSILLEHLLEFNGGS